MKSNEARLHACVSLNLPMDERAVEGAVGGAVALGLDSGATLGGWAMVWDGSSSEDVAESEFEDEEEGHLDADDIQATRRRMSKVPE